MQTATAETCLVELQPASDTSWTDRAWRRVPSDSTVAFRIAFGSLVAISMARLLWRGWVGEFYLAPRHHLTYPRFEWVHPLPGVLMYAHVFALGVLGLAIAAGRRTRWCAALFVVGFAYLELIDAALYLNHYWFMTLAGVVLAIVPAPAADGTVPAISVWALRYQLAFVYVFAGIAKINGDWLLRGQPMQIWLAARTDRPLIGGWLDDPGVALVLSWAGAAFDLTIVLWLLWRRSRPWAYVAVVAFHTATAALFQIGLFPWVMIALTPIFFAPDWPRRITSRRASTPPARPRSRPDRWRWTVGALAVLAALNVVLPLRHWVAPGDVRMNDDGYYLAWRVMVVERVASVRFEVTDPATGVTTTVDPAAVLSEWQVAQATVRPDLILATAHIIAGEYSAPVSVRADAWVSVNGRPRQRWIDPDVDLAHVARTAPADTYVLALDPPVTS